MVSPENLNPKLFEAHLPPAAGSAPIPEGTMRIHHYTRGEESALSIKEQGLLRSKAEESYARGGTEHPQTFATAGVPSADALRSGAHYIEAYAHPEQLDVGRPWKGGDPTEDIRRSELNRSTVTLQGDLPASQIVAHHEPWHGTARYILDDPGTLHDYVHGDFKDMTTGDDPTDTALSRIRTFYRGSGS